MINIKSLKINEFGKEIIGTVTRPINNKFSKIYLWTSNTYKDYTKAVDLSELIKDIPNKQSYTFVVTTDKANVKKFSGLYFIEFVTVIDGEESDRNLGIVANLITYHECVLNKILKGDVNDCQLDDNAVYINALLTSIRDSIKFGYYEESIKILESLNVFCDTCQDCNDYGETLLIRGQAIGIEDGSVVTSDIDFIPPTIEVDAGEDITITDSDDDTIRRLGIVTADVPFTRVWRQIGRTPSPIIIKTLDNTYSFSGLNSIGVYTFELTATIDSNTAITNSDFFTVTVERTPVIIIPEVSVTAEDDEELIINDVLQLTAESSGTGGVTLSWEIISNNSSTGNISSTNEFSASAIGSYTIEVTATLTNNPNITDTDTVNITVVTGFELFLTAEVEYINNVTGYQLTNTDVNTTPAVGNYSYTWTQISGGEVTLRNTNSLLLNIEPTTLLNTLDGNYIFELLVVNLNNSNSKTERTILIPSPILLCNNLILISGPSNIYLPINYVDLVPKITGSTEIITNAIDWETINSPENSPVPDIRYFNSAYRVVGLIEGNYVFKLVYEGLCGEIGITVRPEEIITISAGASDLEITLPENSIDFIGTGSASNGASVRLRWSGSAGTIVQATESRVAHVRDLTEGTHEFTLRVSLANNPNNFETVNINITVNPATITLPTITVTARAGTYGNLDVNESVQLVSTSSASNNGSIEDAWRVVSSNAATGNISGINEFNASVAGIYSIQLTSTLTSNRNISDTDIVLIRVIAVVVEEITVTAFARSYNNINVNETINLTGGATASDSTSVSVTWSVSSGNAASSYVITQLTSSALPTFTASVEGTYTIEVKGILDNDESIMDTATSDIVVESLPITISIVPRIQGITIITSSYTVTGTTVTVSDNSSYTVLWILRVQPTGSGTVIFDDNTNLNPEIFNLEEGTYIFDIVATAGSVSDSTVIAITVSPTPAPVLTLFAGANAEIELPTNSYELTDATATVTGLNTIRYIWTIFSGPSQFSIDDLFLLNPTFSNLVLGTYVFRLTASIIGNNNVSDFQFLQIKVVPIPTIRITGDGNTILTLPTNSHLSSTTTVTVSNGAAYSVIWTKFSGPSTFTIVSPTDENTEFSNLVKGIYIFTLTARIIGRNIRTSSIVEIEVLEAPPIITGSISITVDEDVSLTLPTNSYTASNTIVTVSNNSNYTIVWNKVSGPAFTIDSAVSLTPTFSSLVEGTYVFTATATITGTTISTSESVTIIVLPAPIPDITISGLENAQITLPITYYTPANQLITVSNNSAYTVSWNKASGPASSIITLPANNTPYFHDLTEGVYIFNLLVRITGTTIQKTATLQITVSPMEVSTAGFTLRTNGVVVRRAGVLGSTRLLSYVTVDSGSVFDIDYLWTKISIGGPSVNSDDNNNLLLPNSEIVLAGVYIYNVRATFKKVIINRRVVLIVLPAL